MDHLHFTAHLLDSGSLIGVLLKSLQKSILHDEIRTAFMTMRLDGHFSIWKGPLNKGNKGQRGVYRTAMQPRNTSSRHHAIRLLTNYHHALSTAYIISIL